MMIYSRPGTAAVQQADPNRLRYAKLTPPARGPFAVPKRVAGIPSRVTTSAGSRPTAAGVPTRPVTAPGPVTFFATPRETSAAPPVSPPAVARPIPLPVDASAASETSSPAQPQAILGW